MATSRPLRPAARVAAMPVDLVVRGLIHTLALMVSGTGSLEHLGAGENSFFTVSIRTRQFIDSK